MVRAFIAVLPRNKRWRCRSKKERESERVVASKKTENDASPCSVSCQCFFVFDASARKSEHL